MVPQGEGEGEGKWGLTLSLYKEHDKVNQILLTFISEIKRPGRVRVRVQERGCESLEREGEGEVVY